jgi:hypothetical protein
LSVVKAVKKSRSLLGKQNILNQLILIAVHLSGNPISDDVKT